MSVLRMITGGLQERDYQVLVVGLALACLGLLLAFQGFVFAVDTSAVADALAVENRVLRGLIKASMDGEPSNSTRA